MPFYEYVCESCGSETEILQKVSDPPETQCPRCHAAALSKRISAAGFRLKGGGWYETDFKSSGKKNLAGEGKSDETKSEGGDKTCGAGACPACSPTADSPSTGGAAAAT